VSRLCLVSLCFYGAMSVSGQVFAQATSPPVGVTQDHQHHTEAETAASKWTFMQDGIVFGLFNHQGGPRGGDEFRLPNWWMGMLSRPVAKSTLTISTMISLDPATVGKEGYREIFQVGEVFEGQPLIDRQHPHDLFMQMAAVWRTSLTSRTGLTIAGGPVGEPALGPVAFMHRASAAENPLAPLGHHTFDSTHIAFGVATAAVNHGPWTAEASVFNGREPDEERWNLEFGKWDSVSGRLWYKPSERWELQVSSGRLVEPEELEHGNVIRTTASASWTMAEASNFSSVTAAYGVNATAHGRRSAVFIEGTRRRLPLSVYGRAELVQVESDLLRDGLVSEEGAANNALVGAFTAGAVREVGKWRGAEGGLGAQVTVYATPSALRETHGKHPVSFQVFFRVRPPVSAMGRMWNMRMSQPIAGHDVNAMPGMSGMK
jgi:hypothetical protein